MNGDVAHWRYELILKVCSLWEFDYDPDVATFRRMFESAGEVIANQLGRDLFEDLQRHGPQESDESFVEWAYQEICVALASCPYPADPLIVGFGERLVEELHASLFDLRRSYNLEEDVKHVRAMIRLTN